jgi:arginine/lysine/ornithine decarboxylase
VPNDNYCKFENWIMPIFDQLLQEQSSEVNIFCVLGYRQGSANNHHLVPFVLYNDFYRHHTFNLNMLVTFSFWEILVQRTCHTYKKEKKA